MNNNEDKFVTNRSSSNNVSVENKATITSTTVNPEVFQGIFYHDLSVVGSFLSQVSFNRPIPMKYQALSCS
ncbi:hypothetical protein Lalb_Chr04g0259921 [Lupinus albus]|uniref:Uncharacterized protein n=1 Tax=Lupinus albus TaxID=3870 RepID=A0A6A4QPN8_LUPAL|nr:hypothetical protein Lalb_Chr04g0259921 [Lupinus albus]